MKRISSPLVLHRRRKKNTYENAAFPSSMSLLLAPAPAFPQKFTAMHIRSPHLLRKKHVTSTATNSRKKTTTRMPTMAPVPSPEPPSSTSEGEKTGRGDIQAKQAEEEEKRHEGEGDSKKIRKRQGER